MVPVRRALSYLIPITLVIVLTMAIFPFRTDVTVANITMLFVLLVLLIAISAGIGPALLTAIISFLSINFFLVQPLFTLTVADPREFFDLIVYLIVAMLAGRLAAQARQQANAASQRAAEQEILYRLTRAFNQITSRAGVIAALNEVIRADIGATHSEVLPHQSTNSDLTLSLTSAHFLLLQTPTQIYGTLHTRFASPPTRSQLNLLQTCATQATMALERIELAERANRSQQFEEADRLKTAILHAVSHDLRTPITIIKTSASNLSQFGQRLPHAEQAEIAATIESEADALDRMVSNLLDLSRLNAGALKLNLALNSIEEIAGEVAARMWQLTHQQRVQLVFPADLPLVSFDAGLIIRALSNIVENAVRYEPEHACVHITASATPQSLMLQVINHGETIPPEVKQHIMEPFYTDRAGHIGLGLPIARGIIEAHHGQLAIEDTPGGGATFVVTLPITHSTP